MMSYYQGSDRNNMARETPTVDIGHGKVITERLQSDEKHEIEDYENEKVIITNIMRKKIVTKD